MRAAATSAAATTATQNHHHRQTNEKNRSNDRKILLRSVLLSQRGGKANSFSSDSFSTAAFKRDDEKRRTFSPVMAAAEGGSSARDQQNTKKSSAKETGVDVWPSGEAHDHMTFCVFGASGDLAKKKIYPSLLALFYEGRLPKSFSVFGYARSKMTSEEFRERIRMSLGCRIDAKENCDEFMEEFLKRCEYGNGSYDDGADFEKLDEERLKTEEGMKAMRVLYLSFPQ